MDEPLTILVAARDEEDAISQTVRALRRTFSEAEVLVGDDGSRDRTAAVAEEAGATVLRLPRLGKGQALSAAERAAPPGRVLLCDAGRPADAAKLYHGALKQHPAEALLHFNLAIALEDLQRIDEALASYEACLQLDSAMADAHFNAARLHEQLGHATKAIRHYSAYRRLNK